MADARKIIEGAAASNAWLAVDAAAAKVLAAGGRWWHCSTSRRLDDTSVCADTGASVALLKVCDLGI